MRRRFSSVPLNGLIHPLYVLHKYAVSADTDKKVISHVLSTEKLLLSLSRIEDGVTKKQPAMICLREIAVPKKQHISL